MSRALLFLDSARSRQLAIQWIQDAPSMTRVEFKGPRRSIDQNSKMWALLTDISVQVPWGGVHLSPADWKDLFLDALPRPMRRARSLDGLSWVNLARNSSNLKAKEMGDLIDLILLFMEEHGVKVSHGIQI